ncbi:MAG: PilZ domain-containing protein [Desulfobacteraceae bacterium]|nr:PilZ domain-containing protein [Desulfobacteraceae bacterium]MBC2756523.1 PilZ domain-containing protein [Desulfobacteraceae bacterium]
MARSFKNGNSISAVTAKLIDIILKMPFDQRRRLLSDLTETQGINSRKHDRKDYLMNVQYMANDQLYNGFINNISSGGLFIECPQDTIQRLNSGQPVTLTFDHPDKKIHIKITGEIARIENSGFAVSFDDLLQGLVVPD